MAAKAGNKGNGCRTKIEFFCDFYHQQDCAFFEQHRLVKSTCCRYGLYERKCRNVKANLKSLEERVA